MADRPYSWTNDQISLVEAVATQTRSAVESARIASEEQVRLSHEALLGRLAFAIRSTLDPDEIQRTCSSLLGQALGVDRCFYATYDEGRDLIEIRTDYCRGEMKSIAGEFALSDYRHVLDHLFAEGTAVVPDMHTDLPDAFRKVLEGFDQRATIAVPLLDDGTVVAALFAATTYPRRWTRHEVGVVEQAATLTRTALESVRISRKEHAIAQRLQAALQPPLPERVPGLDLAQHYRPALDEAEVGGDFSDVFQDDQMSAYLVVGDLAGKGLAAASQVATIRNMLRFAVYNSKSLADAVSDLSRTLARHQMLSGFATLFVGCYDMRTHKLAYVNCGQEAGVVVRGATGEVATLVSSGPVIGVDIDGAFEERSIDLTGTDILAIFTDGLTEIGPSRREMLGYEGVALLLARHYRDGDAHEILGQVVTGVMAYGHGIARDDQCALVARVLDDRR
jgi:serine phosphatase RsbU (regulator of sigma subunit)